MTPNEAKYLAAQIRKRRNELHLSAAEVARRAGVTTGTVTRLELAQISDPRPGNLVAIGQVLGLDPVDIFVMSRWLPSDVLPLPTYGPYVRAKYSHLPEHVLDALQDGFQSLLVEHGLAPPAPTPPDPAEFDAI